MNETNTAIKIRSLSKTFKTGLRRKHSVALRGLDLDVAPGEVFGFLGPNGAGKTTTIKILVGLLKPDAGQASLFGRQISDVRARKRIAYLPEMPDFYDYLRPDEFLKHCGHLSGIADSKLDSLVGHLLAKVDLDPEEKRPMRKFSKGMLQRVGIAQTMLADPDLYILDEPMTGLDPIGRRWVKDWILDLKKQGKTVFFSSHILSEAEMVCNRVAFLQKGQLLVQGALDEVLKAQAGNWEILVQGSEIQNDQEITQAADNVLAVGRDTMISFSADPKQLGSQELLQKILNKNHRIYSVNQKQSSLEDVFLKILDTNR
jgi:ABC-2 type transport system ATP-binding protein